MGILPTRFRELEICKQQYNSLCDTLTNYSYKDNYYKYTADIVGRYFEERKYLQNVKVTGSGTSVLWKVSKRFSHILIFRGIFL